MDNYLNSFNSNTPIVMGDVYGNVLNTEVVGICNIPIVCIEKPSNGDTLTINECCQFELEGLARVKEISTADKSGIVINNNRISIDCENLIKKCDIIKQGEEIPYLKLDGGEIKGDLTIEKSIKLMKFFSKMGQMVIVGSDSKLFTRKIPDPIDPAILALKADSDGGNADTSTFRTALGISLTDNTSDLNKPVSTPQQEALNTKVNLNGDNIFLTQFRTALNINNLNNTSDLNKPISTPQQEALNTKVNLSGNNIFLTQFRTALNINNLNNTSDLNKPVSTPQQEALNTKADSDNVMYLTGDQSINGIKTFNNIAKGQLPVNSNDWVIKDYIDEVAALTIFSNQVSIVDNYRTKILDETGFEPTRMTKFYYNLLVTRIANITGGFLPEFLIHSDFSFDFNSPGSTAVFNVGTANTGDGNIINGTVGDFIANNNMVFSSNLQKYIQTSYLSEDNLDNWTYIVKLGRPFSNSGSNQVIFSSSQGYLSYLAQNLSIYRHQRESDAFYPEVLNTPSSPDNLFASVRDNANLTMLTNTLTPVTSTISTNFSSNALFIGSTHLGSSIFNSTVRAVMRFKRTLTVQQIKDIYNII